MLYICTPHIISSSPLGIYHYTWYAFDNAFADGSDRNCVVDGRETNMRLCPSLAVNLPLPSLSAAFRARIGKCYSHTCKSGGYHHQQGKSCNFFISVPPWTLHFIAFRRTGSSKRHTKSLLSPAPGGLLQFMMRLPRRVPWGSLQELDQVCAWIYTDENDIDAKIHAANRASNFFIPTR